VNVKDALQIIGRYQLRQVAGGGRLNLAPVFAELGRDIGEA